MPSKLNKSEVINQFKAVHGNKYDYTKVEYISTHKKVAIICSEHGEFEQTPSSHKSGRKCKECALNDTSKSMMLSESKVIEQFKEVHGYKYDYSKVKYISDKEKVSIICLEHGEFMQSPTHHKQGKGCRKCAGSYKPNRDEVIQEFKTVHGEKYDYSLVDYINNSTRVTIICPIHGEFQQAPYEHKKGSHCGKCAGRGLHTNEVVLQFKAIHGDRYNYSLVDYIKPKQHIKIVCSVHGEFQQTPAEHKKGSGCPDCHLPSDNDVVYIWKLDNVFSDGLPVYKIGITSLRLNDKRLKEVAKKADLKIEQAYKYFVDGRATGIESELLKIGHKTELTGFDGASELRALTELELITMLNMLDNHEQLIKI